MLRYELAVLTHGRAKPLARTLASFREHVRPEPARIRVFADAVTDLASVVGAVRGTFPALEDPDVAATHPSRQNGFCRATARLWESASDDEDVDYVLWLEHDFLFVRSVCLEQMASLLEREPKLAQVALVRDACNDEERRAGGVVQARPGAFASRLSTVEAEGVSWRVAWLEHRAFFTTNPSLMRREFMAAQPFPDDGAECEGRYGLGLVERGYRFAYWGDGTPWVSHVGDRSDGGTGY
jgi:hypothetical protein